MSITRRGFIKAGVAGAATSWLMNLPTMAHAAEGEDYKALVCVFMAGGNDHNNTVIPRDPDNYIRYKQARPEVAVEQGSILPLYPEGNTLDPVGQRLGLNKNMEGMRSLFQQGKMAVQLNVGPLFEPMTKLDYQNSKNKLPPKLFSHNDQQSIWQASQAEGATRGWGGTTGDTQLNQNVNDIFSCISVAGNSVFLAGNSVQQLNMSTKGINAIRGLKEKEWIWGGPQVSQAFRQIIRKAGDHPMEKAYVDVTDRAISAESILSKALTDAGVKSADVLPAEALKYKLAQQLNMVAKIIKARKGLGVKRQIFFVKIGGFDTHDNLNSTHGKLLKDVSESIKAFYDATVNMGIAENVTTFTASDFGRTLLSNGDGSDHGWGSHHFIVGGSVKGRRFYGVPPEIKLESATDVGKGRLLPTTSVDQYAATLAKWFGVPDDKLSSVAPNLKNFTKKNMGFV